MPVQEVICCWPTCYQKLAIQWLVGNTGELWPHCPFHHQWVLRILEESVSQHMPVTERENPPHLDELFHKERGKYPWLVWCDEPDCWYRHAAKTKEEGQASLDRHSCPYATPARGFLVSLSTVAKCWEKYDAAITELMEGNYPPVVHIVSADDDGGGVNQTEVENPEKTRLKGVCRGMAEMLAELMTPHFRTTDEIVGEGMRRYKAKKAGEEYETPGLGGLAFAKQRSMEYKDQVNKGVGAAPKAPKAAPVSQAAKFKPEELKAIKAAKEMGMMNEAELAKMYKVNVSVIEEILKS